MNNPFCKICNNPTVRLTDDTGKINYYGCSVCEYIFIAENHILEPEQEKQRYLNHENSIDNVGYVNMFVEFIAKSVTPYREHMRTALDFGCGTGPVLAQLLQRSGLVVDIYDLYFVPEKVYEGKKYDLITVTEVLEHLKNVREAFQFFKDHLTVNGIVSIMTLFHSCDREKFKVWWYRRDNTHISFYTVKTIKCLADQVGLDIVFSDAKNVCVLKNK